jgi:hypothetical protein
MTYLEIWNKHLENMKKKLVDYVPSLPVDSDYFAVIVEPRIDENIETIIKTVMYYLEDSHKKWGLQIFHGTKNVEQILSITKNWDNVSLVNLGKDNLTKREYNDMMMTTDFWNKVKGKKILSFQNDSILLKGGIDQFLKYDYIGAPWIKPKEGYFVGNGGLSLRNKDKMIEICKLNDDKSNIPLEDIFFVKNLKGEGVADIEIAYNFSMEDIFSEHAMGLHNPIKIDPNLLEKMLLF